MEKVGKSGNPWGLTLDRSKDHIIKNSNQVGKRVSPIGYKQGKVVGNYTRKGVNFAWKTGTKTGTYGPLQDADQREFRINYSTISFF